MLCFIPLKQEIAVTCMEDLAKRSLQAGHIRLLCAKTKLSEVQRNNAHGLCLSVCPVYALFTFFSESMAGLHKSVRL